VKFGIAVDEKRYFRFVNEQATIGFEQCTENDVIPVR